MSDQVSASSGGTSESQSNVPTSAGSDAVQMATEAAENTAEQGTRMHGEKPVDALEQKFKVTIDGQVVELPLREIMGGYQKASAANKRFMEAAKKEKDLESRVSKLKSAPIQAMLDAGISEQELQDHLEQYLVGKLEYEKMTPEQKRLKELEQKLAEKEAKEKEAEERRRLEQEQAEVAKWEEDYNNQFIQAMEEGRLPKTAHAARKVAEIMYSALESGHDLSIDDAIDIFNEDHNQYLQSFIKSLDVDAVQNLLGEDFVKKVRKSDVEKVQNPTPKSSKPQQKQEVKDNKKQLASDFFKDLDKKYGKYALK
jgi:hypothetical protein